MASGFTSRITLELLEPDARPPAFGYVDGTGFG
jgi:hypothetical protein